MSGKKTIPLICSLFFGILFIVFFSLFPSPIHAQYACSGYCATSCGAGYNPGAGDCVDPEVCCVQYIEPVCPSVCAFSCDAGYVEGAGCVDPMVCCVLPSNTPRPPSPTPIPDTQGLGCCSTSECRCGDTSASWSCHGVGPGCSPKGVCYCSDPDPIGSCTGWGACTLQYNGWYCQTQTCDAGCTCDKRYSSYEGTNYHRDCFI